MKISNYMKSALRNLLKNKLFSAINIFGLAIGFATCILIMLFIKDELSYDEWISDSENIYRLELTSNAPGIKSYRLAATMGPLKPFIKQDFPAIEQAARLLYEKRNVRHGNEYLSEEIAFVDDNFFQIFNLPTLYGEIGPAFSNPHEIIISQEMAVKYFGNADVVGSRLSLGNGRDYTVLAVLDNLPHTTHFDLDMVLPLSYSEFPEETAQNEQSILDDWFHIGSYIYVKLDHSVIPNDIEARFPDFLDRRAPRPNDNIIPHERWQLHLTALEDIHLKGAPEARIKPKGSITTISAFALIAIMILIIACFNFMNLSTARASLRAKEVALRKVLGAAKRDIVIQFISEATLMTFSAFLISLVIVEISLPYYSILVDKLLEMEALQSPVTLSLLAMLTFFVALGAGAHPAFIMSSFRPSRILTSGRTENIGSIRLRTILVIIQFTICISLIVSALVIYKQLEYSLNRDAGYDKDNLVVLSGINDPLVMGQAQVLKERLLALPDVTGATLTSSVPADRLVAILGFGNVDGQSVDPILLRIQSIDENYLPTYGISIMEGRNLSRERGDDIAVFYNEKMKDSNILINEAAVMKLGFKNAQEAIGKRIVDEVAFTIAGVIPNIHLQSTRETANPTLYYVDQSFYNKITLKISSENMENTISEIKKNWTNLFPQASFDLQFLDEKVAAQYKSDRDQGQLFLIFSGLAIIISGLGLYGLASFTADRRIKEIGIRKVMGANVFDVVRLLVWQFSKPVIIANLIAWPVSFYVMSNWLEGFSYRISKLEILWFCLAASAMALLLAWVTVAGNSIRVAKSNPINALRYE